MTIWHFYITTSKINNNCTLAAFQHNVIFSRCTVRHSISNSKCKRLHTLYVYFRQTRIDTTAYFIRSNIFQCDCAAWWRSRVCLFSQSFLSFSLQSFCAFSFAKTRIFTQIYKIVCSFHSETHSMRCVFFLRSYRFLIRENRKCQMTHEEYREKKIEWTIGLVKSMTSSRHFLLWCNELSKLGDPKMRAIRKKISPLFTSTNDVFLHYVKNIEHYCCGTLTE